MPKLLNYTITGLQEFSISFESYCTICNIQKSCKWGKDNVFSIMINCNDLNRVKEKIKFDQLQKLQKTEEVSVPYEKLLEKVKINVQEVFSEIWQEKVKAYKDDIKCLDPRKRDPILVAQQGQEWWQDFTMTMKVINEECEKIS
jgi:hypothetical protein